MSKNKPGTEPLYNVYAKCQRPNDRIRWKKVGTAFPSGPNGDSLSLVIDLLPVNGWDGHFLLHPYDRTMRHDLAD